MQEDVLLVQQALSGDKLAFCHLIQKYYKSVYAQILSLARNPDDTEELANDVFIKAYVNLSALRQPENFHKWLHQIAWNHSRNWLRQRNNSLPLDNVCNETEANFICDSAEDMLIRQEKLDKIFDAIDTLPEMDKSLMQDFYLEGTPYETLQERYKISKPAINARLIRARKRIREQLKDLFSGIGILTLRYSAKDILTKGVIAVKVTLKAKLIVTGIAILMILGGTGVWVWHSHQSTMEMSESSISQTTQQSAISKNPYDKKTIVGDNIKNSGEKQKEELNNAKNSEQMASSKDKIIQETKEPEIKETPLQKYQRIYFSPEFRAEFENATAPYEADYERWKKEVIALLQKKKNLESDLASASGENQNKIQKELEKVETDYKKARIQACISFSMMSVESDRVTLKYFTTEEYHEALFQMAEAGGMPTPPPLPTKEEGEASGNLVFSQEEWAEAERQLNAKGINTRIFSPPSQALYEKYVLHNK